MKIAISYANDKFSKAQRLNTKTAYKSGNFDKVIEFGPKDIDKSFYLQNKEILGKNRGGGYWLWKPYIIKKTLEKINYGDYLFYCDSGAYYCNSIDYLVKCLEKNEEDMMAFEIPLIERQWTKRDAFILMDCELETYYNTNQRIATYILFKKTDKVMKFIEDYLNYATDKRILTDIENKCGQLNYEGFIDHRHDQSIFSLLTKKYKISAYREPSQYGDRPWEYIKKNRYYYQKEYSNSNYPRIVISYRKADVLRFTVKEKVKDMLQRIGLIYI